MVGVEPSVAVLTRMVERSDSPCLLVSATETIVALNSAAAAMAGVSDPEALIGASLDVFDLGGAITDRNRELFAQVAAGTVLTLTAVVRFRRLDGGASSTVLAQTGVALAEGPFVLMTVVTPPSDVLRVGTATPVEDLCAVVTDHDWRVAHATAAARDLFGRDDGAGIALFGLIHPLDITVLASALEALTPLGSSISREVNLRCGDGWCPVAISMSALCEHSPPRLLVLVTNLPSTDLQSSENWIDAAVLGLATSASEGSREFSDHELEIIARSLRGQRPSEIAAEMYLNRGTVRNALSRIYRRFHVSSQTGLIAAILQGQHGT